MLDLVAGWRARFADDDASPNLAERHYRHQEITPQHPVDGSLDLRQPIATFDDCTIAHADLVHTGERSCDLTRNFEP